MPPIWITLNCTGTATTSEWAWKRDVDAVMGPWEAQRGRREGKQAGRAGQGLLGSSG